MSNNHATNPLDGVQLFFQNYINFNDIATRGDYWWNVIGQCIIFAVLAGLSTALHGALGGIFALVFVLYALACIIPDISLAVRRLRGLGFGDNGLVLVLMTILYEAVWLARLVINLVPNTVED